MIDLHVHFMPERVLRRVWAYFDDAERNYGLPWPVQYRMGEPERIAALRGFGVRTFAPLVYAHKPGMARWLNAWVLRFAAETSGAVGTATFYPEPDVEEYLREALDAGARCVKLHVQVGGLDPRDPLLDRAWGLIAEAGIPAVVHCGDGPLPGRYTGHAIFAEVLRRHPALTAVIAHAGLPDYLGALDLVRAFPRVHLDTTMVGTAFAQAMAPLPADWTARLADVGDRIVLGSDYPNIPYPYAEQIDAITGWATADDRLGLPFLRAVLHENPARLLGPA
jgi:predicted TIM-barrel fold metal-dependent hydrolase